VENSCAHQVEAEGLAEPQAMLLGGLLFEYR
jgi:hypothetical protein